MGQPEGGCPTQRRPARRKTIGGDIGGFRTRGLRNVGLTLIAFPVWYPVIEEGGLRWPRADDVPLYAAMIGLGLLIVWVAQRKA